MTLPKLPARGEAALTELFADRRPTRWVTREHPKIDRIACPWAIRRFIDPRAEIIYTPTDKVFATAERERAIAFDIPGAPISHEGELCSFDTLLSRFGLEDAGLAKVALIVRGADTDRHDIAPESAGLHAISLGLARLHDNDHELLAHGMLIYDALYAWATAGKTQHHSWQPAQ